ncbi:MAG: hypothetical protein J2P18_17010 [Nocardia sp.]|nr:hypothetical protein [Nocardia sp.]
MIGVALAHAELLAQNTTNNPTGPEFGKASPIGLVIVLVLLVGTALLIRSMNRHIKGLPADFSREHPEPDQEADEGTEHGAATPESEAAAGPPDESSGSDSEKAAE